MRDTVRSFGDGLKSVREARHFLVGMLEDWQLEGFDFGGPLVLTELATNAALYAPPPYLVRLSFDVGELRVEVHDSSVRPPRRRDYGQDATTGRGLNLVAELCDDWGYTPDGAGKIVWASVRVDEETPLADLFDLDDFDLHDGPGSPTASGPPHGGLPNLSLAGAVHHLSWAA